MRYEWYKVDGMDLYVVADKDGNVKFATPYAAEAQEKADELNGVE